MKNAERLIKPSRISLIKHPQSGRNEFDLNLPLYTPVMESAFFVKRPKCQLDKWGNSFKVPTPFFNMLMNMHSKTRLILKNLNEALITLTRRFDSFK